MTAPVVKNNWLSQHPQYKQVSVEVDGRKLQLISPVRKEEAATYSLYERYLDRILQRVTEKAQEKIERGPGLISDFPLNAVPTFVIRGEVFAELIRSFQEEGKAGDSDPRLKNLEEVAVEKTGLSTKDYIVLSKKVLDYALEFFSNYVMLVPYNEQEFFKERLNLERKAFDFLFEKMGIKKDPHPIQFSEETLKRFGVPKEAVEVLPTQLSCLQFVLLEKGEKFAAPAIFQKAKNSFLEDQLIHHIFDYLPLWGYTTVESPVEGDIVVYLDFKDRPTHVGIFKGDDKVYSKLGVMKECAYEHSLFSIHDRALFYRKK